MGLPTQYTSREIRRWEKNYSRLLYISENSRPTRKSIRLGMSPLLDATVLFYVQNLRRAGIPVTRDCLMSIAKSVLSVLRVEGLKASTRWLEGFRDRYNLKFVKLHGEKKSADIDLAEVRSL